MKKLLIIVIVVIFILALTGIINNNTEPSNNDENTLENQTNTNINEENITDNEKQNILDEENLNNSTKNDIIENENTVQEEEKENETDANAENKVPDETYVGQEENSKDDYDTELDGENKAIALVKKHLGENASKYTLNVETTTSSAYVVRAMDEDSSNTYFSVNFTTWVVSEI